MKLWIEKRKQWRMRARMDGKKITVIKDLGIWEPLATEALVDCRKADAAGFVINPKSTTVLADARAFLKAKKEGVDTVRQLKPIPIEAMCDLYLEHHGPSLKGGVSDSWHSNYSKLKSRLNHLRHAWAKKQSDEITSHDVRDLLANLKTVGTRMKLLRTITHMFRVFGSWNEEGVVKPPIKLPPSNPGSKWRASMKPEEKRELPDTRVLSQEEWQQFARHLRPKAFAICDIALRRFLRKSDIRAFCERNVKPGRLEGIQAKTGDRYSVPQLADQPTSYDFTNFEKQFEDAQVAADMWYPKGHPLRFTLRSLRRTGATWAYRETKDLEGIRQMLGHRSLETTRLYLGITEADLSLVAKVVDRLAKRNRRGEIGRWDEAKMGAPVGQTQETPTSVSTK